TAPARSAGKTAPPGAIKPRAAPTPREHEMRRATNFLYTTGQPLVNHRPPDRGEHRDSSRQARRAAERILNEHLQRVLARATPQTALNAGMAAVVLIGAARSAGVDQGELHLRIVPGRAR